MQRTMQVAFQLTFPLGLALLLLTRGPVCDLVCDSSWLTVAVPASEAAHHGAAGSPCHGPPPAPGSAETPDPSVPHDEDCASCGGFALARAEGPAAGAAGDALLSAPQIHGRALVRALDAGARSMSAGRLPTRNLLLLKSTLLI